MTWGLARDLNYQEQSRWNTHRALSQFKTEFHEPIDSNLAQIGEAKKKKDLGSLKQQRKKGRIKKDEIE